MMASGRTLAIHMYALLNEGLYTEQAYATAVVLLVIGTVNQCPFCICSEEVYEELKELWENSTYQSWILYYVNFHA